MMRKRRKSLLRAVRVLRQRRIIGEGFYYDYMSLILTAETPDQLKELAIDFTEICYPTQGRLDERAGEKEEETIVNRPPVLMMGDEALPIQGDTKAWGEPGVYVDVRI